MRGWSVRSRVGAVVAAIVVAAGAAGCGSQTASGGGGNVAAAALSQARQQLKEAPTARLVARIKDGTKMGVPGEVTAEGVLDMANLQGRVTYHYVSMGKTAEMLLLSDAMYVKLPEPKDGKAWVRVEGMSGKAMFEGMDPDSVGESLDSFGTALREGGSGSGTAERTFTETITVDQLRDQLGATNDAPVVEMLSEMNVTSMTGTFVVGADDALKRMSIAYGDFMTIEFSDFGAPTGDLTPPTDDQVLVQQQPQL
ncbi:hypothetical protein [Streptodolium elevatio]|uniref:Lipoprotein n=1 Tax=Streptodolium elevatio TaxID=3157996 RepID=A0ABV3DGY0_9ACTN